MAILCCCGQLRPKQNFGHEDNSELPTPRPPAKLPSPVPHHSADLPRSTTARSSLTNPLPGAAAEASVKLGELVVEDSDDERGDHSPKEIRNRSTSTLQAVKSRIRRHLSQDSLSRQSETEEQIARRAEVKRLMRKRIQEELQTEADYATRETSTLRRPVPGPVNLPGNGPRDTIEFTVNGADEENQLDKTKVNDLTKAMKKERHRVSTSASTKSSAKTLPKENQRPGSRAASLPDWIESESKVPQADCHIGLRERSSLPEMPSSPLLRPVRPLSLHDTSPFASWQLSASADRLGDFFDRSPASRSTTATWDHEPLRRLRSKSSPLTLRDPNARNRLNPLHASLDTSLHGQTPPSQSLIRDESPMGLWLRTQSPRFRFSNTSRPQTDHESEEHSAAQPLNHEVGLDGAATPTHSDQGHLYQVDIHLQLGFSESSLRSDTKHEARRGSFATPVANYHIGPERTQVSSDPAHRSTVLRALPGNSHIGLPHSQASATALAAASNCPTQSPGPANNKLTVPTATRKGFGGLKLPSFKWNHPSNKNQNVLKSNPTTAPRPGSSNPSLTTINPGRATMEAGSETSSFLRREAELQNIEERFRDSHLRKEPLVPVASKFQEVFDNEEDPNSSTRGSLLSKLHLTTPKEGKLVAIQSFDGHRSDNTVPEQAVEQRSNPQSKVVSSQEKSDGHLKVPVANHGTSRAKSKDASPRFSKRSDESSRPRGFSSSKDGEETAELWKRALKAEAESRPPRGSISAHMFERPLPSRAVSDHELVYNIPQPSAGEKHGGPDSYSHSPMCTVLPTQEDDAVFRESLVRSNTILEDWSRQLERQEHEAKERTRTLQPAFRSLPMVSKMPPASWARFPSHNRNVRNGAAAAADNVKPKDFAVKEVSTEGTICWTTDRIQDGSPTHKNIVRSFSDKLTQPLKLRWSKLIPGRSATPTARSMKGQRRSSIQTAGDLEYPELELPITAGNYKELSALEAEIDEMKALASSKRCPPRRVPVQHHGPGLTNKITHTLQHKGCSDIDFFKTSYMHNFVEEQAGLVKAHSPETPATQVRFPDATLSKESTGSTVERYATPFSHLSSTANATSRALTPQNSIQLPPTAHSPGFAEGDASVVRRASLDHSKVAPHLEVSGIHFGTWNMQRSCTRRKSAPLPFTAGLA